MPLHTPTALPVTTPTATERPIWMAGTAPWKGFVVDPIAVLGSQKELAATEQHRSVQELVLELAQSIVKKDEIASARVQTAPTASFRKGAVFTAPPPGSKSFLLCPVTPEWTVRQD